MSALTTPVPPQAVLIDDPVWRMSVDTYHAMIDIAKLTPDDPVELVEGALVFKMPKKPAHRICNDRLDEAVRPLLPAGWFRQLQEPITLSDSEPEPDLSVYQGRSSDYTNRHPGAADVVWVVEIADTTLRLDRGMKRRMYARAGIAVYWIINLSDREIVVHAHPDLTGSDPSFGSVTVCRTGDRMPVVIAGREVGHLAVDDLLP